MERDRDGARGLSGAAFRTTHWSMVLQAARADEPGSLEALNSLCAAYWKPIYAYVRRRGYDPHEAQDLVQSFFASVIASNGIHRVDQSKGRFRSWLLGAIRNHLTNEHDRRTRQKRGGGFEHLSIDAAPEEQRFQVEPISETTPERVFERRWAQIVLERAVDRLREDFAATGQEERFEILKEFLFLDASQNSYADAAARLGISVSAVTSAIHRMRVRFRSFFREEIAHTVEDPAEIDDEIRSLASALAESS
jgi:RNA polymerase sigma factor (sigma-70 family)